MVFGSTVLEIAIGVIFVYLLMSLLCSALAEFFESLFKFRARDLEKGISKLLSNPELTESFFNQPMVTTMFQGRKPSYIPSRTFSLARSSIEAQYNDATERGSCSYKSRTHWILIGIGLLLAVLMNVDSINIVKVLSHNEELRTTVVAAAENYAKAPLPGTTPTPAATPT